MKREENMKFKKKYIYFFKYLKNSNNIPSISKTIQHTPMTWCTYLQSFEKNTAMRLELVRKLHVTDGQTDGRGALQYLPSPNTKLYHRYLLL